MSSKKPKTKTAEETAEENFVRSIVQSKVCFVKEFPGSYEETFMRTDSETKFFGKPEALAFMFSQGILAEQETCWVSVKLPNGDETPVEVPVYMCPLSPGPGGPGPGPGPVLCEEDGLATRPEKRRPPYFYRDDLHNPHHRHVLEGPELHGTPLEVQPGQRFFYVLDVMNGIEREHNILPIHQQMCADGTDHIWPMYGRIRLGTALQLTNDNAIGASLSVNEDPAFKTYCPQYLHAKQEGRIVEMKTDAELQAQPPMTRTLRVCRSFSQGRCCTLAHTRHAVALDAPWQQRFVVIRWRVGAKLVAIATTDTDAADLEHQAHDYYPPVTGMCNVVTLNTDVEAHHNPFIAAKFHTLNLREHQGRVRMSLSGGKPQYKMEQEKETSHNYNIVGLLVTSDGKIRYFAPEVHDPQLHQTFSTSSTSSPSPWRTPVIADDGELERNVFWCEMCEGFPVNSIPPGERFVVGVQLEHEGSSAEFLRPAAGTDFALAEPPALPADHVGMGVFKGV